MSYGVIYKITNIIDGKCYIGQTIRSFDIRWKDHVRMAVYKKYPIQRALLKYGQEGFTREIICECSSQEELNVQEKYYVNFYNTWAPHGYNLQAGRGTGCISEETRRKKSDAVRGEKHPMFGRKHSEETRKKLSLARKKRVGSKSPMFGKHPSEELIARQMKTHCFVSPAGEIILVVGLKKFCREYTELDRAALLRVSSGKQQQHKGWRRGSPEGE